MAFHQSEYKQAASYAKSLLLQQSESVVIDQWLEAWVELVRKNNSEDNQTELFLIHTQSLRSMLDSLSSNSLKYLLGRLIKVYDLTWSGTFSPIVFDSSLSLMTELIDETFSLIQMFTPIEFTSLLAYLQGASVNPNSGIFSYIWKIEKNSRFFRSADFFLRNKALHYLLHLNAESGYHHTIKDFKKILNFIKEDNTAILNTLRHYKVKNHQGCYQFIHYLFSEFMETGFNRTKQCILWLDNAAGRTPKKPWMDKLSTIQQEFTEDELRKITQWILTNEQLKRESATGWSDQIYARFYKSSEWYGQMKKAKPVQ